MLSECGYIAPPVSNASQTSVYDYTGNAKKGSISGTVDSVGGYIAKKAIKETRVYVESGILTIGRYESSLSTIGKCEKKALGIAGTIGFTTWDAGHSLYKGEYVGAGIDVLSGLAGYGAGFLIGLGTAALITASTPILLAGAIGIAGFALSVGAGVVIDKIASSAKDKYYGRC